MEQDRLALLALHFIPGVGDHLMKQLISYCGSAQQVFAWPKGKLMRIPGIGRTTAEAILKGKALTRAEQEWKRAQREQVRLLFYTDADYPKRLRPLRDAPTLLYVQGPLQLDVARVVAIVGTRQSTDYGRRCVDRLMEGLQRYQPLIISGLAYGIDVLAHQAALRYQLPTAGIMGSGMDHIYPAAHRDLARRMLSHGGLVTELPFGTKPDAHHFPARNRIIAGLSDAIVIVEAAERGGALITADIGNSYNKDVFALPGDIEGPASAGCHQLIRTNKANLITKAEDIAYMMNWSEHNGIASDAPAIAAPEENLSEPEQRIVRTLRDHGGQLMIDELAWRSGMAIHQVASVLLGLEFNNKVSPLPGKLYKLNGR